MPPGSAGLSTLRVSIPSPGTGRYIGQLQYGTFAGTVSYFTRAKKQQTSPNRDEQGGTWDMRTTAPPFVELSDPIRREILRRQERYPVEALEELQPTDYKLIQPFPTADVYHVATLIGGRWQTCFCHYCQSTLFYQGDDGLLHCADPDCRSARIDVTEEWPI